MVLTKLLPTALCLLSTHTNVGIWLQLVQTTLRTFWVAQVEKVHKDCHGVPETLTVRWFEPSDAGTDEPLESLLTSSVRRKKTKLPWIDEISVSTILVTFESLSRKNKISSYKAKKTRDALEVRYLSFRQFVPGQNET